MSTISVPCSRTVNNWIIAVFAFNPFVLTTCAYTFNISIDYMLVRYILYSILFKKKKREYKLLIGLLYLILKSNNLVFFARAF